MQYISICQFLSHFSFQSTQPIFTLISVHCAVVEVANFQGKKGKENNTPIFKEFASFPKYAVETTLREL